MKRLLFIVNVNWFFISHRLPVAIQAIEKGHEAHIATTITGCLILFKKKWDNCAFFSFVKKSWHIPATGILLAGAFANRKIKTKRQQR
jgi:hypothetical protein